MTTVEPRAGAVAPPERPGGQGLDSNQYESGERAIALLLTHDVVGPQTDFVATYRDGAYEVWARRGMIRFERLYAAGGGYEYRIVEQIGENPIERQDYRAISTIEEELEAAAASGYPTDDPDRAYIEPEHTTYPFAYERIAQLFDSPNAPDLVVNPKSYAFGRQIGQHGALDVVQSRSPLVFFGPGVRPGVVDAPARQVDVAPTICRLMGFPLVDGRDITGRTSSERGVPPDVYLRRQDGRVLAEVIDDAAAKRPERVYLFLIDGLSNSELLRRLEHHADEIPNLARLVRGGCFFRYGSMTNFPSITWPSHNTIGTGAWCGHHDIVNPTYYLRERRETVTPQGQQFDTAKFLGPRAETLYEAFHRVYGPWDGAHGGAFTVSIHEPCTRGADHATLERRLVGDRERLKELNAEFDWVLPRWQSDGHEAAVRETIVDNRGLAQVKQLFTDPGHPPPAFTFHEIVLCDGVGHDYGPHSEALWDALRDTDRRIGAVLDLLTDLGLFDTTLFAVTTDHGMAATDVSLKADQTALLAQEGMAAVATAPLVYLLDMAVDVMVAADGRTATITVVDNDADERGECPPVEGAEVTVMGPGGRALAHARTDAAGVCGVALPVSLEPGQILLSIRHPRFNPRHLRLDGTPVLEDLRKRLYGA